MFGSLHLKWKANLARIAKPGCDNPATRGWHPVNTVETFSVSGYGGAAGMAVYSAGKAFDAKLAESLWMEKNIRFCSFFMAAAG